MWRRAALLAAAMGLDLGSVQAGPTPADLVAPADFDYYVLTLSWSPGFCDTVGAGRAAGQCDRETGAGFVVHGLWPDSARGRNPEACGLAPDYIPPPALALGERVYPTRPLALHEWRTHGTCTGLDAAHYFRAVQYARDEFTIPSALQNPTASFAIAPTEIVKQFEAANANLTDASVAVTCERGELIDVRFCLTRDLRAFARCPKVTARGCSADSIRVAPVR